MSGRWETSLRFVPLMCSNGSSTGAAGVAGGCSPSVSHSLSPLAPLGPLAPLAPFSDARWPPDYELDRAHSDYHGETLRSGGET